MNKTGWMILIFTAMALAQWWIPVNMIMGSNRILEEGTALKFRCAPVDPNDPFRGKFIILEFDITRYETDSGHGFKSGQEIFLEFRQDSLGFARVKKIYPKHPGGNIPYLKTYINYIDHDGARDNIHIDIPFSRFYLEESKAPIAEELYRNAMTDTSGFTFGLVYLLNGDARIKDVMIRATSLLERLRHLDK